VKVWSNRIAGLAVDALVHAKVVPPEDYDRAVEIVSEEILVRLCLEDFPPTEDAEPTKQ
jgi:hypothetical protein